MPQLLWMGSWPCDVHGYAIRTELTDSDPASVLAFAVSFCSAAGPPDFNVTPFKE